MKELPLYKNTQNETDYKKQDVDNYNDAYSASSSNGKTFVLIEIQVFFYFKIIINHHFRQPIQVGVSGDQG